MLQYRTFNSLRTHSVLICAGLLLLTTLLVSRVLSLAQTHSAQMNELVNGDLRAQSLLPQIEALQQVILSTRKKLSITHDPTYAGLLSRHKAELKQLKVSLGEAIHPAHLEDISRLREDLDRSMQSKLQLSREAADGILRLVIFCVGLATTINVWIIYLFYRKLNAPIRNLKKANAKIAGGKLAYRIEDTRGVTELQDLAESFNLMASRLEQLDRTKYEFLSAVSHEVKNPLAALKEGLSLLAFESGTLSQQSRQKAFSACLIASKRLESMIGNLLHHSRIEKGFGGFSMETKDLGDVVHIAMDEVRPLADKKHIQIQFLPDTDMRASFSGEGMTHVFENLLMNAIKYGEERSVIRIGVKRTNRTGSLPQLELNVSNKSKSAISNDISRLFDRFYRGANSSQQNGLGLGLYIVKAVIESHHGTVSASMDEERCFSVRMVLPALYETESQIEGVV